MPIDCQSIDANRRNDETLRVPFNCQVTHEFSVEFAEFAVDYRGGLSGRGVSECNETVLLS